jgi:hypothetical protein
MGVVDLSATNLSLGDICNHTAMTKWYTSSIGNNLPKSMENARQYGAFGIHGNATGIAMKGGGSINGFERMSAANGSLQHKYRFVVIYGQNCQVNISYPYISTAGVVHKSGSSPTYNRSYITASESSQGKRLHVRGINYVDYSYMTFNANNFSYGYGPGIWIWYTSSTGFNTTGPSNANYSLYSNTATSTSHYYLAHIASVA